MDVPPQWADLQMDMLTEIVNRLPCAIDRARMAAVCREWRAAVSQAPLPPPRLPSLLLAPADATSTGVYCYLSGCRDHNAFPGPRHFGSYDGAWLFLAYGQTRGHRLLNIRTGESHAVPDELTDADADDDDEIHGMVVLAATLSFPPAHPECVAAGIVVTYQPDLAAPLRRRRFAFWRPGDGDGVAFCDVMPAAPVGPGLEEQEDVVYYRDAFYFLTNGGHILVFTPILDVGGAILVMVSELFRFQFQEGERTDDLLVRARYLVASRGELLMVVRLAPHHHAPTSSFKVFRMTTPVIIKPGDHEEEADEYHCTWSELPALGGRMLFVGRGCSRSYEVDQYPGFKDGIFFLDDRSFYDDEMMFRGVNERQYPCSDIGWWSSEGPPPHVDLYFPERVPSYSSPPAWLLL